MNVRSVAIHAFVLLLMLWSTADATSVSWISGITPPKQWAIDPANPTPSDVIRFSGPTPLYSNVCDAERALDGTPQLLVDTKARVITLWFQGPAPQICPLFFNPVVGLQGEFGPLPAGDWVFTCLSRDAGFEIRFTIRDKLAYYVDAGVRGSVHNGRSWETAMLTLQDALAVAGSGVELVLTLGTGLGSALFDGGHLAPHLELSHAPVRRGTTYDGWLGEHERRLIGDAAWSRRVGRAVDGLRPVVRWDRLYLGGGNSRRIRPAVLADLGDDVVVVPNSAGIVGGVRAWSLPRGPR